MMGKTHYVAGALFAAAGLPLANAVLGAGFSPAEMTAGVAIGTIAGVLPDIDHPDSLVTKGLLPGRRMFGRLGKILGWWLSIPPRVIGVGARSIGNHRGPTHTMGFLIGWALLAGPIYGLQIALAAVVGSALLNILSGAVIEPFTPWALQTSPNGVIAWLIDNVPSVLPLVMCAVALGYYAHLVTDGCTKVPLPFWWPLLPLKRRSFFPLLPKPLRITTDSPTENRLVRPVLWVALAICYALLIALPMVQGADAVAKDIGGQVQQRVAKQTVKVRERARILPAGSEPKTTDAR